MEFLVDAAGVVLVDGVSTGLWTLGLDRTTGVFEFEDDRHEFSVETSSDGYCIAVRSPARRTRLVYTWRDGFEIVERRWHTDLWLDETELRDADGVIARVSRTSAFVRVRFRDGVPMEAARHFSVLTAVNMFFWDRTGPFERHPSLPQQ